MTELALVLRVAIGAVLSVSAATKLTDLRAFSVGLREWDLLPAGVARWIAGPLAATEACLGLVLLSGVATREAAAFAAGFFCLLFAASALVTLKGRETNCHCFGKLVTERVGPATLIRLGLLILFATAVSASTLLSSSLEEPRSVPLTELIPVVTSGLGLALVIIESGGLLAAWSALRRPVQHGFPHDGRRVSLRNLPMPTTEDLR